MRLFSYCIPTDDGAAPNPYGGKCTLTICKPVIRRVAKKGDWIVGVGSKNVNGKSYEGRIVYAMKVTDVKSLKDYDRYCRRKLKGKIPDPSSPVFEEQIGDCIYDYSKGATPSQRLGVHKPKNQKKDLRGKNALLSNHFYYFGKKAKKLPPRFLDMASQNQGHRSKLNDAFKEDFVKWLTGKYDRNELYGSPQLPARFGKNGNGSACATSRCNEADKDEVFYKKNPNC